MMAVIKTKGEGFRAKLRALSLAAAVYLIWKERNYRIFKHIGQDWMQVMYQIEELIRVATWKLRNKRSL